MRSARRRYTERALVIEGLRLVREALAVDWVFYTEDFAAGAEAQVLLATLEARDARLWSVSPEVLRAISDTETPQGIVALVPIPELGPAAAPTLRLALDGVRDPGNLGTILRAAWAAGVEWVLLPPGVVDPTNPKVLRAGMGAHFHVPVQRCAADELPALTVGTAVWLADVDGAMPYDAVDWRAPITLVVGGEATGAGPDVRALVGERRVFIPMARGVESLNAAMAATVLLFEIARQRRMPM